MRNYLIIVYLIANQVASQQKGNLPLDSAITAAQVETFIRSYEDRYERFTLKKIEEFSSNASEDHCKRIADSLGISRTFYMGDFDVNGNPDILAIGKYYDFEIFILMNFNSDSTTLRRLTRNSFQDCVFPAISNDTLINYYYLSEPDWLYTATPTLECKKLVYKFDDFIEFNESPESYKIEKITYETTLCFGTCPEFRLEIDESGKSKFIARSYNQVPGESKEMNGTFKARIDPESLSQIFGLLNYLDFPNLKDSYSVNWTCDQSSTLKVTYDNGKTKEIHDYGLLGTYGLDRFYQMMFDLRFSQDWK